MTFYKLRFERMFSSGDTEIMDLAKTAIVEVAKDIYEDGLKSTTKESGEALQAVVGLFNNVILYPIKKQI